MAYEMIDTQTDGRVLIVTLSRPDALNALCAQLVRELRDALEKGDADPAIGAMIITGSEKAFAAGADIKEMESKTFQEVFSEDFVGADWRAPSNTRKPIIAAVAGYALGGGCEVAMMCDFIIAAENAKFGQPEVSIGTIPGAGGTQRMAQFIGKAKAMDLCLTGRMMGAEEAERSGLVARVVPVADLMTEALEAATKIAEFSRPVTMMIKESIDRSFEMPLGEGLAFEHRIFHSTFALEDRKEGMSAFVEKRQPAFKHK